MFEIKASNVLDTGADVAEVTVRVKGFKAFMGYREASTRKRKSEKPTPEQMREAMQAGLDDITRDIVATLTSPGG